MPFKTGALVYVEWEDAESMDGWSKASEILESAKLPHLVFSVGWVLEDNDKRLVLASHHDHTWDACDGHMTIPRAVVKKVKAIKL